jgi:hypothetical protein
MGGRKAINLADRRFGSWRVLHRATTSKARFYKWTCECVCGKIKDVWQSHLKRGYSASCGCVPSNNARVAKFKGVGKLHRGVVTRIARGAEIRGIAFDVTVEELWALWEQQEEKCVLSGLTINLPQSLSSSKVAASTASLDRIDSSLPYQTGNVRWVHKKLNIMRNRLSDTEFVQFCRVVVQYHDTCTI